LEFGTYVPVLSTLTVTLLVCFYAFMRTTVELPPELMRQAKARAASQGESLKTLLTRAVAAELGRSRATREASTRVRLPLFGNPRKKTIAVSNEDIARAIAVDDQTAHVRLRMPRRK
jgi:hypothetical protein